MMTWSFWYRRNRKIHDDVLLPPQQVIAFALSMRTNSTPGYVKQVVASSNVHFNMWNHPPHNALKLNIDGALFFDLNKAGLGAILRNHEGDVIMAVLLELN